MERRKVITVRVQADRFEDFIRLVERGAVRRIETSVRFAKESTFLDPDAVGAFTVELWDRGGRAEALRLTPGVAVLGVGADE